MGTVTEVTSVIYNLLGDDLPMDMASTAALQHLLGESDKSISEDIVNSITSGHGSKFKRYMSWSKSSLYQRLLGLATSDYYAPVSITSLALKEAIIEYALINLQLNQSLFIDSIDRSKYLATFFADYWVYNNKPDLINTNYTTELKATTKPLLYFDSNSGTSKIRFVVQYYNLVIKFLDGSSVLLEEKIYPKELEKSFLYIKYNIKTTSSNDSTGDLTRATVTVDPYMIIYESNSGFEPFDNLFIKGEGLKNTYSAFVPFRIWNRFISDGKNKDYPENNPELYKLCKKAVKLALGLDKYDLIRDNIADNKDIDQVDFAYLHFGVPLNISYQEGKKYIYTFFDNLYKTANQSYRAGPILPRGFFPSFSGIGSNSVRIYSPGSNINFDIRISWNNITKEYKQGLYKPLCEPGKYYTDRSYTTSGQTDSSGSWYLTRTYYIHLIYQESYSRYQIISIEEASQSNYVYAGRSTYTKAYDTILDTSELSDFIVPIQYNTFSDISLAKANEIMQYSQNLVFNCYVQYKKKWYQSGLFRFITMVIVIIIAIVIIVFSYGSASSFAAALVSGVGGALAGAIGLTAGTLAYMAVAAVVNFLVAILISKILIKVSTALFGLVWGTIIGTIAAAICTAGINAGFTAVSAGSSFASGLTSIFSSPLFYAQLTVTSLQGYASIVNMKVNNVLTTLNKLTNSYTDKMDLIQEKTDLLLGVNKYSALFISNLVPQILDFVVYESRESFLGRTLMTGSDYIDVMLSAITNFTKLNLSTDLI